MNSQAVILTLILLAHTGKTPDEQPPLCQILGKPPASVHLHDRIQNLLSPVGQDPLLFGEVAVARAAAAGGTTSGKVIEAVRLMVAYS